jgi:hypothetical protein
VQDSTVNYSEPHECGFAAKIAPQSVVMDTNVAFLFSALREGFRTCRDRGRRPRLQEPAELEAPRNMEPGPVR